MPPTPPPNDKLTRYWRRKRKALLDFLDANPQGPQVHIDTLDNYIHALIDAPPPPPPNQKSLEEKLNDALDAVRQFNEFVSKKQGDPNNPPPQKPPKDRRSARLVSMVQGAVEFGPGSQGFYATVSDIAHLVPGGGAHKFRDYADKVEAASVAAAEFLEAATHNDDASALFDALDALLNPNRDIIDPSTFDELEKLRLDIESYLNRGGTGEGSAYWPSVYISSSTSGP